MAGRGFRVTAEGLEELGADMGRLKHPGLRNAILKSLRGAGGQALATEMRTRAPRRTGGLVDGIDVHSGTAGSKGADDVLVGYQGGLSGGNRGGGRFQLGAWIESGTAPHEIVPRDGGSLKFNGGSFERVMHPGIRGRRVAAKSMKAAEWEVMADIVDVIDGMLSGGSGRG
jgi:hypothetical protein